MLDTGFWILDTRYQMPDTDEFISEDQSYF